MTGDYFRSDEPEELLNKTEEMQRESLEDIGGPNSVVSSEQPGAEVEYENASVPEMLETFQKSQYGEELETDVEEGYSPEFGLTEETATLVGYLESTTESVDSTDYEPAFEIGNARRFE